jgi:ferredoxin
VIKSAIFCVDVPEQTRSKSRSPALAVEEIIVKLIVDKEKCAGHARCAMADPELFELDLNGYIAFSEKTVPPGKETEARRGENACPEQVIRLTEDD